MTEFNERVRNWMFGKVVFFHVAEVVEVEPVGNDYYGSTAEGFDTRFSVLIRYKRVGEDHIREVEVEGNDMANLWKAVVR